MLNKNDKLIALVTGANRGIGLAVARQLAQNGMRVILTSRNPGKGEVAAEQLTEDGLDVLFHTLDVTSETSVASLGEFVHSRCGRLDCLINNAGIYLDSRNPDDPHAGSVFNASLTTLETTLKTNVYGPLLLAQEFVPLMKHHHYGRIVNVSSGMGQLDNMGGRWPAYRMSKTALNALTRILAAETMEHNILVNAVCPGWVRTDLGGADAERTPDQGAETIVWAATLPDGGPNGGFFRDRYPIPW